MNHEYVSYFCKSSYQRTLIKLIQNGEYCKTPKRNLAMYCFGSTITCTRYPKFMHDGTPKILPRPYSTSKPRSSGYKLIRTSWFQSLLKDIETQVIHFLQNISFRSSSVIKALLSISLSKQIIPECLWLGDTCFTHMTTFGTLGKEDGSMPIHFDERDAVSCIFHLGSAVKGGATQ